MKKAKRILFSSLAFLLALQSAAYGDMPPEEDFIQLDFNRAAAWVNPFVCGENLVEENIGGAYMSLNGEWSFGLFPSPAQAEERLFEPLAESVTVPSAWQLCGFDYPIYSVERYPWAGNGSMDYPFVPEADNPTALYSRSFTVPDEMNGGRVYLCFDRGGSAMNVYVNGSYAGYGEGCFLQKSFDISNYLHDGENELTVEVMRYSDTSYLENRDGFNLSGLFGDVSLRSPYTDTVYYETAYENGKCILNLDRGDADEAFIEIDGEKVALKNGRNELKDALPWSCEAPELYSMTIGKDGRSDVYRVGFRSFEASGEGFLLNGEDFAVKAVRYSAFTPDGGYYADTETIQNDVSLMKELGVNTVITDSMPLPSAFYDIADEEGLLVVDCAFSLPDFFNTGSYADVLLSYMNRMILRDGNHCSVVMWGAGTDDDAVLSRACSIDSRPFFSKSGRVYGSEASLPSDIPYFSDEALYAKKGNYEFTLKNKADGGSIGGLGEIKNYVGSRVLGKAELDAGITFSDEFTLELWLGLDEETSLSAGGVSVAAADGRIEFSVGSASVSVGGRYDEGTLQHIGAVYTGNELRLFVNDSFRANLSVTSEEAAVGGSISSDGIIGEIRLYNRALDIDELCGGETVEGLALWLTFDEAEIINDYSFEYLGYGGDFGDYPNSGSGVARGIFTAEREPLPEAAALKELYLGDETVGSLPAERSAAELDGSVTAERYGDVIAVNGKNFSAVFRNGQLSEYVFNGKNLLSAPIEKSFVRPKLSSASGNDYLRGEWKYAESFEADSVSLDSRGSYADISTYFDLGELGSHTESFRIYGDGTVLVYAETNGSGFEVCADMFELDGSFTAEYLGYASSTYSDFIYGGKSVKTENIAEKLCPYLLPREFGNHSGTDYAILKDADGGGLVFSGNGIEFDALAYSFDALDGAMHNYELEPDGKTYVRVGGYVAPLHADASDRAVSCYKFKGIDGSERDFAAQSAPHELITSVAVGENELKNISPLKSVYTSRYSGGEIVPVCVAGVDCTVEKNEDFCEITASYGNVVQEIRIYFLDEPIYISDLTPLSVKSEQSGEIAFDSSRSGGKITVMGDRWRGEEDKIYDKGITTAAESEISFDVSRFKDCCIIFTAAMDSSAANFGQTGPPGGFGRNVNFYVYGDGELLASAERVSMFGGAHTIKADISETSTLTLVTSGSGGAAWCGGEITSREPKLFVNESGGRAEITVVNTTGEEIHPLVCAISENAQTLNAVSRKIRRGCVESFEVDVPENGSVVLYEVSCGEKKLIP